MGKIHLKGANNARDFGGIKIGDKAVKPNCFLRSNALDKLTKNDVDILKSHRLNKIIDLRTDIEMTDSPDIAFDFAEHIHIPVFSEAVIGITHENNTNKMKMLSNLPDMTQLYKVMVTDSRCIAQLREIFKIITDNGDDSAVLWHCTEGKDRCGLVSALFLFILGADSETVYNDYLETNIAAKKKSDKYYFLIRFLLRKKREAELVREIYLAKTEYLDAAINAINQTCGSVDDFIRQKLEISDETKESMRKRYLK